MVGEVEGSTRAPPLLTRTDGTVTPLVLVAAMSSSSCLTPPVSSPRLTGSVAKSGP